ncbi:MAG: dephospho-CoA kinase [Dehalococcoidales bacterium]|nr:dephospho-CoA kinase [Dehalococcoidales bacterium]
MTKVIGLTGNIGCGKTAVAAMLRRLGAEFVDADVVVHGLLGPGGPLPKLVAQKFGHEVIGADGGVDRQALARIVFADPRALGKLERLVHPAVRREVDERIARSRAPVLVVEAIKLIESGMYRRYDQIWVVTCTREQQIERLVRERHMLREEAVQRINAQPPPEEKLPFADVIVDNSGSLDDTWRQVKAAWDRLTGEP